jgi:hypothetical protein
VRQPSVGSRGKAIDVKDQSNTAIAKDGGTRKSPALFESVPQTFDDHFLLPNQAVHEQAAVMAVGFNHDDD